VAKLAAWGCPGSGFPSFDLQDNRSMAGGGGGGLGYVSYGEIGRVRVGLFPSGYKSGGDTESDGVPLALVDRGGRAVVLSPSNHFFDTVFGLVDANGASVDRAPSSAPTPTNGAKSLNNGDSDCDSNSDSNSSTSTSTSMTNSSTSSITSTASTASHSAAPVAHHLRMGLMGTASTVPQGTATQVLLRASSVGNGLTQAHLALGDLLMAVGGRKAGRPGPAANAQVARLGYSSVGHYFYGVANNHSSADTLTGVVRDARAQGVAFGWVLVDSWWYREGAVPDPAVPGGSYPGYDGVWLWDDDVARSGASAAAFPAGLAAFVDRMGDDLPLVMHMGEWTGSANPAGPPPYAADPSRWQPNSSGWNWVVEPSASLPMGANSTFWDWLFARMVGVGLRVYKLDHAQQQAPAMNATMRHLGATADWLKAMADAAARHGVDKQYGGHMSSAFLHSTLLPNAVAARVSDDYIPDLARPRGACVPGVDDNRTVTPRGNVLMGRQSLYAWAVSLRPYKDAFFSSSRQSWRNTTCFDAGHAGPESTGYTKPEWWGLQDPRPELNAVASALSAGPVASGDGWGDVNATLLKRLVRADGVRGGDGGGRGGSGGGSGGGCCCWCARVRRSVCSMSVMPRVVVSGGGCWWRRRLLWRARAHNFSAFFLTFVGGPAAHHRLIPFRPLCLAPPPPNPTRSDPTRRDHRPFSNLTTQPGLSTRGGPWRPSRLPRAEAQATRRAKSRRPL
jgi:hypothetical protein